MGEIKTRIVGVIVRTRGKLEDVIGHLYEEENGIVRSPFSSIAACEQVRTLGPEKIATGERLNRLLQAPVQSLARC